MSLEITALADRLAPASDDAILRSLSAMQTAGMTVPPAIDPRKLLSVYQYALSGAPACGLSVATQKLIRGDYAGNTNVLLGTVPKPPVLAALAKSEAAATRAELARKREIAVALSPALPRARRSPEIRERVRERLCQFRADHATAKAKAAMSPRALAPDRAEALARMPDLPDAGDRTGAQQTAWVQLEHDIARAAGFRAEKDFTMEVAGDAA